MAYSALYRKWRSRTFDEVKGQDAITQSFKNQVKSGRIAHAYLFTGTRGTGKTSAAKILARAVNCEHPVDGNPCNECESCKAILNNSSLNVVEMDAASNNGVEDIRAIRERIEYPPVNAKYKVYIIDEVHMLSTAAFNAFLKTLEEPPEYVIFILATTEPNKIPITILSRCQRYDFRRISTDVITERLEEISRAEQIQISRDALSYIARVGDGSMRDSISLLDECAAFQFDRKIEYEDALKILGAVDSRVFSDLVRALSKKDIKKLMELVSETVNEGRDLNQFSQDFLNYIRNMLLMKEVQDIRGLVDLSLENMERLREDQELFSVDELLRFIRMLSELSNQLRFSRVRRVLLETQLLKMAFPETDVTVEGINARIADLKRTITSMPRAAAAVGNTPEAETFPEPEVKSSEPERVLLPEDQKKAMEKLKNDWKSLKAPLKNVIYNSVAAEIPNTWIYRKNGHPGILIGTTNPHDIERFKADDNLGKIRQYVREHYGIDEEFSVVCSEKHEGENTVYVTEDEIENKIHFPVDETDDQDPDELMEDDSSDQNM